MNEIKTVLDKVVSALAGITGIQTVVLGGSRARGTNSSESDIDIGIYYDKATFDLASLNKAAQLVDDEHRDNLVVPPGQNNFLTSIRRCSRSSTRLIGNG